MKCNQRLCHRNKNLKESGYCSICDDLMNELKRKYEPKQKPRTFQRVELDLKLLQDTHNKLMQGISVDPKVVNNLLLAGITNILYESETIEETAEKVKALEMEVLSDKARLESLENWTLKLNENVEKVGRKLEIHENTGESTNLEDRMDTIDQELNCMKESINTTRTDNSSKISCKDCGETFAANFQLENHMVKSHGKDKSHSCDICGKDFFLRWRLRKHLDVHDENVKICRYFRDGILCPFDEVGCKFKHEEVKNQENEKDIETEDNLCYYCNTMFESQEDLIEHMGEKHIDQFEHYRQANLLIS